MVTQQTALKTAKEFVKAIRAKGFNFKKAIVFGSFVRDEQRQWSDIDLALVADEFIGVGYFDSRFFIVVIVDRRASKQGM